MQGATLSLYHDVKMTRPIEGCEHVTATASPIHVSSDSVYFNLNLGYSSHLWGIKATVTANVDQPIVSVPFVLDLLRSVTLVCSRYCKALITGDVVEAWSMVSTNGTGKDLPDSDVSAWIKSDLLQAGLESADAGGAGDAADVTVQVQTLLQALGASSDLLPHIPPASSGMLPSRLCKEAVRAIVHQLPNVDSVPIASEAAEVVQSCIIDVFSVLIHHNHLTEAVSSLTADRSVPVDVLRCWKAAHR